MAINTYNETDLHLTLKKIYALEYSGKMEQKIPGTNWICDIITDSGDVIEIQTSNISALKPKIVFLLSQKRQVRIVHPIAIEKIIETYDKNGNLLSKKKSPRRDTIYSVIRSLTGMYDLLGADGLTLELIFVNITELRQKTDADVQLANKSRRHLKNWIPCGKRLEQITQKKRLCDKKDFLVLIPVNTPRPFRATDLQTAIQGKDWESEGISLNPSNKKKAAASARLVIWLLTKMNLLKVVQTKGRSKFYDF